jgi:serine/threonine protein kinase
MFLGSGAYGSVFVRDDKAVKTFSKLSHLIQEYLALRYLDDCEYVVHAKGVDFAHMELEMELYDCSLRKWLELQHEKRDQDKSYSLEMMRANIMIILRDVLIGLVELHDRELAHGDLKPGNILIRKEPLKAVLGDCGFVSVAKYAKVDRTAAIYRDPIIGHDRSHDMFSFGICFLEMIAEIKINRQPTYEELKSIVKSKIENPEHRKIIYNLLHEDKERRPDSRSLLYRLFKQNPTKWVRPNMASPNIQDEKHIRSLMKNTSYEFGIHRGKKGYGALLSYIDNHNIPSKYHHIYAAVTLMILSSIFGKSGFREQEAMSLCEDRYDLPFIYTILGNMMKDTIFVNILLRA